MPEIKEFELKKVKIQDIKFDDTNPNVLSTAQMDALKKVIKKFGYLAPVILNKDLKVVDGEHRVRVYDKLGKKAIPAYVINVKEVDKKMLRQLMNKLRGEHDKKKDADEFKEIFDAGKLKQFAELMAEDEQAFQQSLKKNFDIEFHNDDLMLPAKPTKAQSKPGEIYQLGRHRIMCGDSTKSHAKLMGNKTVDLLVTDPPYGVDYGNKNKFLNSIDKGNRSQNHIANDSIKDYNAFFTGFLKQINFSDYNAYYIFMGNKEFATLIEGAKQCNLYQGAILVWVKNNHVLSRSDYNPQHELILYGWKNHHKFYGSHTNTTVLKFDKPHVSDLHPTMKPVDLLSTLIQDGSEKDMIVFDPFLGSGSTLMACEQTGRICYGIELEPIYIDVIIKRWENYTGKTAKKITS